MAIAIARQAPFTNSGNVGSDCKNAIIKNIVNPLDVNFTARQYDSLQGSSNIRHFWHIWQRLQSHFDQGNQAYDLSRSDRRRDARGGLA